MRRIAFLLVLGCTCLTLCAPPQAISQQTEPRKVLAPESLLPADAVAYVRMDGSDLHKAGWEKTAAYDVLEKSGLRVLLERVIRSAVTQSGAAGAEFLSAAGTTIYRHGLSATVTLGPGEQPLPQVTVVLHRAGLLYTGLVRNLPGLLGSPEPVERMIGQRRIRELAIPNSQGYSLAFWIEGEHLVLGLGTDPVGLVAAVVEGSAKPITSLPLFKQLSKSENAEITSYGWVDLPAIRARVENMPVPGGDELTVGYYLNGLGLDGLGLMTFQSGYQGEALFSSTHTATSGEARGLLSLMRQEPITLKDLPPLPAGLGGFWAASFDAGQAYDQFVATARRLLKKMPDPANEQFEKMLDEMPRELGFDLKSDLLDPLGNVVCIYGDPHDGLFGFGIGVAISLDDGDRVAGTLDKLLKRMEGSFSVSQVRKQGREITTINLAERGMPLPVGISYSVGSKWLVAGLSPQSVEAFSLRESGKLPSQQADQTHPYLLSAEQQKLLPEKFTMLSVTDPRPLYTAALNFAPMAISTWRASMRGNGPDFALEPADLPPAQLVTRAMFPNVTVTTVDDEGVTTSSRSSAIIPALSAGDSPATAAVLVGLLLPAVQQARMAARGAQSKNNLKQMGLALHNYHDTFNHFPRGAMDSQGLDEKKVKDEDRFGWQAAILPYLEQAALYNTLKLDVARTDDANAQALKISIPVYRNPNETRGEPNATHYVGIAGFGKDALTKTEHDQTTGIFGLKRVTRMRDILDGTSNTMMVTEATPPFGPWSDPKASIKALTKKPYVNGPDGIGGPDARGFHILMGDGSVRFVSVDIDATVLESLSTAQGGESIGSF